MPKIIKKHGIEYQKVPPTCIITMQQKKDSSTFKDHLKAILAGVDKTFSMHMLCPTNIAPKLSAYAYMFGQHNYNKMPLAPMGCAVMAHNKPHTR